MGAKTQKYGLLILFLIFSGIAKAQFVQFAPVPQTKYKKNTSVYPVNAKVANYLTLPFWDDFSQGMDTLSWDFEGSTFSSSIGNSAPSFGVILLDGVDADGTPYSRQVRDQGAGDYLTSKPFDLSGLSASESASLYLSFFWQAGGKAERPDENDRLTVQFLNASGQWETVWDVNGGADRDPEVFTQEILQVGSSYQHEAFQFRFVNMGRLSGPFDSWLVDYIFLNTGRNESSIYYLDRALTQFNYFQIGSYAAVPAELIGDYSSSDFSTVQNEFYNLENRFRAMEYSIAVLDQTNGTSTSINLNTPFNPVPNALERRVFESREIDEIPSIKTETDLEVITYLTTGDKNFYTVSAEDSTFYDQVDFKINDTVRTQIPIRDYFAYDHGSADYAAGINQKAGRLAVKYEVDQEVFLKGISINFTNPNQVDLPIDILVWQDLSKEPIFAREELIPLKEEGEDLLYFSLDTNLRVIGEFYIGFAQYSSDFIHVGLDKTNNQADKIYYNVAGAWAQNEEVLGSLMIRPHVSIAAPFEQSEETGSNFKYYPNPVETQLTIEGEYSDLRVYDSFGREIFLEREAMDKREFLNFIGQKSGIYVINLITKDGPQSFRILVK
ncbi:T9SS type A sorting domain-containing protein [Algoriphagus zhangzhouensis]|uniref:Por secretion system C-terminal sorting domain-containing protein n=1 Tax=Algoriphagus zhangzhouensis TaxID=1073327 RepID=A0A1M7Z3B2_9BACT|nr:T9SS type A sorting domain-containing protein [Algoriphagus zhangzhouensis]TDY48336.1 putative secreted protein (Por secretion system target) [Algoriphagus zhangzhouensis]SHO59383.1 Por secretion system C-terminal sorting domain-containing protein [Algoriphagus zhangzhouensis]